MFFWECVQAFVWGSGCETLCSSMSKKCPYLVWWWGPCKITGSTVADATESVFLPQLRVLIYACNYDMGESEAG